MLECPCNGLYGGDPTFYPKLETKVVEPVYHSLINLP